MPVCHAAPIRHLTAAMLNASGHQANQRFTEKENNLLPRFMMCQPSKYALRALDE